MQERKKVPPAVAAIIVIVLIGAVVAAVIAVNASRSTENESGEQQTSQLEANAPTANTGSGEYLDGTYQATGSYVTPGGVEEIGVTVTLEGGIITSASLDQRAEAADSKQYQQAFASGFREIVVGESIDDVEISRVAGSSLTSTGFYDALDEIKIDAAA